MGVGGGDAFLEVDLEVYHLTGKETVYQTV